MSDLGAGGIVSSVHTSTYVDSDKHSEYGKVLFHNTDNIHTYADLVIFEVAAEANSHFRRSGHEELR